jgi:NAD(P)H dehydrogenase (quinone)
MPHRAAFSGPSVLTIPLYSSKAHEKCGLASLASEISGRSVEYVRIDSDTLKKSLMDHGVPEMFANLSVQAQLSMKQGLMGPATTAFRDLTGQSPTSVADFFRANRVALTATAGR